jgi:beta-N-acetylhexosaminidase
MPVSVSTAATTHLLREHLGFHGVVVTDSLSADAITAAGLSVADAAVRALQAGADEIIVGRGDTTNPGALAAQVRATIAAALHDGRLTTSRLRESVRRLASLMGTPTC